ncbi:hypothetical protein RCL1_005491 [Eukaryota sp. TZLM3-RCL]
MTTADPPLVYESNANRRHVACFRRKGTLTRKAHELSLAHNCNILLVTVTESGTVSTYSSPLLQPLTRHPHFPALVSDLVLTPPEHPHP